MPDQDNDFLSGLSTVLANLNREVEKIGERTKRAMQIIGLGIKRLALPRTPVDTGNLRNSMFYEVHQVDGKNYAVIIGYTASYAVWVHEDMEASHKTGTEAKFLERTIDENHAYILDVLRQEAQIA